MSKIQNVIIIDVIIHENLKTEKQFDSCNRAEIVWPRLKAILQKLKKKIQADIDKLVKLKYEFSVSLK